MRSTAFLLCAALCAVLVAATARAADFVGPESCKACHPAAYAAWHSSKHARAYESLSTAEKKDARCTSCHAPELRDQQVAGVSCESCHGGGQYYSPEYVMRDPELARRVGLQDPSEKMCRNCHDASSPSLRPFDFVTKLKLIDHWSVRKSEVKPSLQKVREAVAQIALPASPGARDR